MTIPAGYSNITFRYGGAQYPNGAAWSLGWNNVGANTPETIAAAAILQHFDHLRGFQVVTCTLESVLVKNGPDATGPSTESAVGTAGTVNSVPAAPSTSFLVRKVTGLGGRQGRGRIYFPGGADAAFNDGGVITGADIAALNLRFEEFIDDMVTSLGGGPVLLHEGALSPTAITDFQTQTPAANQRRRQRR